MKHVTVITHPLVQHNLARLRDERTPMTEFRRRLSEVAALMTYEATRSLAKLLPYDIEAVITYHGGLYRGDVRRRIGKLVADSAW